MESAEIVKEYHESNDIFFSLHSLVLLTLSICLTSTKSRWSGLQKEIFLALFRDTSLFFLV